MYSRTLNHVVLSKSFCYNVDGKKEEEKKGFLAGPTVYVESAGSLHVGVGFLRGL